MPIMFAGRGPVPLAVGPAATTWNSFDKNAAITLSNSDLTATSGASATFQTLRATKSMSGLVYWKVHINANGDAPLAGNMGVGFANSSQSLTQYLGHDNNGLSWFDDGTIFAGSTLTTADTWAAGDDLYFALDLTHNVLWVNKNNGLWNLSGGDPTNPSSGNGTDISGMAGGPYFPAAVVFNATDAVTADFLASGAPAGYSNP